MKGQKFWIGVGVVLILLAGLGYYGNNQLNKMIDTVAQSGLFEFQGNSDPVSAGTKINTATNSSTAPAADGPGPADIARTPGGTSSPNNQINYDSAGEPALTAEQSQVANGVQNYLGRRVDRRDLLTAGNIVISRFSWGEINYLYQTGSRGIRGAQDAHQVRNLLLSRLGPGDIATLTALGNKYGLSLRILDSSFDIDKAYGIKK